MINLVYSSSVDRFSDVNSSFDKGVLRIAYHGKNRNNSYISKETFERYADSAHNCPIVANYIRDDDMIGGHDIEIVKSPNGMKLINVTQPVGVVPESSNFWWESIEEEDGTVHEYLCTDILIWKRQEAYSKIKENVITNESMEITIKEAHTEDGVIYIDAFEFTAFCLLERDMPCFESAGVELFSLTNFKEKYSEMMNDFKQSFSDISASFGSDSNKQNLSKGGNISLDKMELLAEYNLSPENLDFSIDELSVDELREKLEAMNFDDGSHVESDGQEDAGSSADFSDASEADEDDQDDDDEGQEEDDNEGSADEDMQNFNLLGSQLQEQICCELAKVKYNDPDWGQWNRYSFVDFDAEACEVYAFDMADHCKLVGFSYHLNGDNVVIDFDSVKRKKFSIVDFDEGSAETDYDAVFNSIREKAFSFKNEEISQIQSEMDELKQFKLDRLAEDRAAAIDKLVEQFSDLAGVEAFSSLIDESRSNEMSVEDIENKCFEIRGRNVKLNFSASGNKKPTRTPVERTDDEDEPYGGLFLKYGYGKSDK